MEKVKADVQKLLGEYAVSLADKALQSAMTGNVEAMRLCFELLEFVKP